MFWSTGLAAGSINKHLFVGLPYLLPGLIMFTLVICIDIMAILLFFREAGDEVSGRTGTQSP